MFIGGVMHDPSNFKTASDAADSTVNSSFFHQTYGYIIIMVFCIIEKLCIQWLTDKFGCTENVYSQIEDLEKRLQQLHNEIQQLEGELSAWELNRRRENMKML